MENGSRSAGTDQRPSLGTLVADIASELSHLVRGEIDLAKAEIKESVKAGAAGGAMLAVAGVLMAMVWLLLTWAAVYGLAEGAGLPVWASFLIVGGVYLLIAVIVALLGVRNLKRARGPEQAVIEMQRTKEIVQAIPPNTPPVAATISKPSAPK
jgi:hypothetical protein